MNINIEELQKELKLAGNNIFVKHKSAYELIFSAKGDKTKEIIEIVEKLGKIHYHDLSYTDRGDFTYGYFIFDF